HLVSPSAKIRFAVGPISQLVPPRREKRPEHRPALLRHHSAHHLHPVIQPLIGAQPVQRLHRSRLWIRASIHQPLQPPLHHRPLTPPPHPPGAPPPAPQPLRARPPPPPPAPAPPRASPQSRHVPKDHPPPPAD